MIIIFPIRFNRLQWCNDYLDSLPRWRFTFDSRGRKYFFLFNLIFPIFYLFCNKSSVPFYIKFNALAKSSHQPLLYFFKSKTHYHSYGYRYAVMSDILITKVFKKHSQHYIMRKCALTPHFLKFAFCQICVAIFLKSKFPTYTPQNPC